MMVENVEIADIDTLVELRLAYLKEDSGELSEDDILKIRQDLPNYFRKNLNQNIFCYLIRDKEEIAACAFLLVIEKPMSPAFITGRTGTVLNVYTNPVYRHKGYAKQIMNQLLSDAVEKNLSVVELKATDAGYHLYKSMGFVDDTSKYHSMKWYKQ
ncbi:MAG: GNAT family N-acetyltransferase [Bacteroides sp.]|nr:GNAT family N-acetyltransferase [Bacteroides sp.]MCM1549106.1 GNAT family N-acetyltransferase [Clostridium sp.]